MGPALTLLVPPRILLLFRDEAYLSHLHGIVDRRYDEVDSGTVANWNCEQAQRLDPTSAEAPEWAARQLKGFSVSGCTLQRDERYSLTIRRVPVKDPVSSPDICERTTCSIEGESASQG